MTRNEAKIAMDELIDTIYDNVPAEIGKCKDCDEYKKNELGMYCYLSLNDMAEDDFCSKFKRKE